MLIKRALRQREVLATVWKEVHGQSTDFEREVIWPSKVENWLLANIKLMKLLPMTAVPKLILDEKTLWILAGRLGLARFGSSVRTQTKARDPRQRPRQAK